MTSAGLAGLGIDAAALAADLTRIRHEIHRHPEIGLDLPMTQATVLRELDGLSLEITTGQECSSVVAVLRGAHPGPTVLLRGDMDALPLTELAEVPYRSEVPGAMHACGHDMHTAMLIGAARLLKARQAELHGNVSFMFQPGEEGYRGALVMLQEGLLEATGELPEAAYAIHVYSGRFPLGHVAVKAGAITSASAQMTVTVRGSGGHGSRPHLAKDPIFAACEMVTGLQGAISRRIDIFDPVVLTVGRIEGGTVRNVIPDTCTFDATVRAFSPEAHRRIEEVARSVCEGIATANDLEVEVDYVSEYPAMLGTAEAADTVREVVGELFGADHNVDLPTPMYGSEDFAFVLEQVPGSYAIIGAAPESVPLEEAPTNHSSTVIFDDAVLPDGAALLTGLAVRHLSGATGC